MRLGLVLFVLPVFELFLDELNRELERGAGGQIDRLLKLVGDFVLVVIAEGPKVESALGKSGPFEGAFRVELLPSVIGQGSENSNC